MSEMEKQFDAIILTVPKDFSRLERLYYKMEANLPVRHIYFIGSAQVGELLAQSNLGEKFGFIDEESLVPFENVRRIIQDIFGGQEVTRGFVGWYYQQFLKMQYAKVCKDDYYLSWDGDTIPVRPIEMFAKDRPYMDWKREYHEEYFHTMEKLFPGMHKVIEPSFIAEHMLFSKEIMSRMIGEIEAADHLEGAAFYERILRAIGLTALNGNSFSEFETYGTYVALRDPMRYVLRRWTSFRNCGQYFDPDDITEEEMDWLSKDFHAISFEKGHVPEQGAEFFRNKDYQKKLSARYILEVIQEEMTEGYRESWD